MSTWSRALDELVRERGPALFGYAYVLTGNSADAEDLVQTALVRTFRTGRASQGIDSTHAYVKRAITAASSSCSGSSRSRSRRSR
jgi:RNA polymerase sigma-70 factor (ECF subfamily)